MGYIGRHASDLFAGNCKVASAPSITTTMLRSLSRARPPLRAPTCTRAATYPAHYYNYKSPNDIPIRTNLKGSELLNTPAVSVVLRL